RLDSFRPISRGHQNVELTGDGARNDAHSAGEIERKDLTGGQGGWSPGELIAAAGCADRGAVVERDRPVLQADDIEQNAGLGLQHCRCRKTPAQNPELDWTILRHLRSPES